MWFYNDISEKISNELANLFAYEGYCLRFTYLLDFYKSYNNEIFLPLNINRRINNNEFSPMNLMKLEENLIPIYEGRYEDSVLITRDYNKKYYNKILKIEKKLKAEYINNKLWIYFSFTDYYEEVLTWVKSLSYTPMIEEKWADIFGWHSIDNCNDIVDWYESNKLLLKEQSIDTDIYIKYFNFKPVNLYYHEIMYDYIQYMKENQADKYAMDFVPTLKYDKTKNISK